MKSVCTSWYMWYWCVGVFYVVCVLIGDIGVVCYNSLQSVNAKYATIQCQICSHPMPNMLHKWHCVHIWHWIRGKNGIVCTNGIVCIIGIEYVAEMALFAHLALYGLHKWHCTHIWHCLTKQVALCAQLALYELHKWHCMHNWHCVSCTNGIVCINGIAWFNSIRGVAQMALYTQLAFYLSGSLFLVFGVNSHKECQLSLHPSFTPAGCQHLLHIHADHQKSGSLFVLQRVPTSSKFGSLFLCLQVHQF